MIRWYAFIPKFGLGAVCINVRPSRWAALPEHLRDGAPRHAPAGLPARVIRRRRRTRRGRPTEFFYTLEVVSDAGFGGVYRAYEEDLRLDENSLPDEEWERTPHHWRGAPEGALPDPPTSDVLGMEYWRQERVAVYRSDDLPGRLVVHAPHLVEQDPDLWEAAPDGSVTGWYSIPARPISPGALAAREPAAPEAHNLRLVPEHVAALYQPARAAEDILAAGMHEITLAELESLITALVAQRNAIATPSLYAAAAELSLSLSPADTADWHAGTLASLGGVTRSISAPMSAKETGVGEDPEEGRELIRDAEHPEGVWAGRLAPGGALLDVPIWEDTGGGSAKNWAAIVCHPDPASESVDRYWLGRVTGSGPSGYYDFFQVRRGHAVEFGADYVGPFGPVKTRWLGAVIQVTDSEIFIVRSGDDPENAIEMAASIAAGTLTDEQIGEVVALGQPPRDPVAPRPTLKLNAGFYEEDVERAKELGRGDLWAGVRMALAVARLSGLEPIDAASRRYYGKPAGGTSEPKSVALAPEDDDTARRLGNGQRAPGIRHALRAALPELPEGSDPRRGTDL